MWLKTNAAASGLDVESLCKHTMVITAAVMRPASVDFGPGGGREGNPTLVLSCQPEVLVSVSCPR